MTIVQPHLGFGLGLRVAHYDDILATYPAIDWFEIISEDFMVPGGRPWYFLDKICNAYPLVMHGVSLSIGSVDPLDLNYLQQLKKLMNRVQPRWVSDHLCWTGMQHINAHDLLPLPYTEEALNHVVSRVRQVQDILGQRILLENPSSYVMFNHSTITEWDFLNQVAKDADCLILLDINNIYVSSFNHGFDPLSYLYAIDKARVQQFHLAGHFNGGKHIIDTHDSPIIDPVWQLYQKAVAYFGQVSTMIERDDNIPPLMELLAELQYAKQLATEAMILSDCHPASRGQASG